MNRLSFWADHVGGASAPDGSSQKSKKKNRRRPTGISVERYRREGSGLAPRRAFFTPLHYEPNYAYPLLVWLPGAGGDQRQLHRVMPHISLRNHAAVSVRGSVEFDAQGRPASWTHSSADILAAEDAVFEAIDEAREKFNIAADRIFLAGYADGGTMALRIGLRRPESFAAALSLAGPFPVGDGPLVRLSAARRLPLFIAHGRDANDYPIDALCGELRLFHAAGMSATVRQYPCGDELDSQMLHDMNGWIMEHVTGVVQAADEAVSARHSSN